MVRSPRTLTQMVTQLFMRLVNAVEKSLEPSIAMESRRCATERQASVADTTRKSVELGAFDPESSGFESLHDIVDRLRVAGLAFDLDHRVLRGQLREDTAVVDLDDVDPRFVDLGGDRGERPRLVVGGDVKPR